MKAATYRRRHKIGMELYRNLLSLGFPERAGEVDPEEADAWLLSLAESEVWTTAGEIARNMGVSVQAVRIWKAKADCPIDDNYRVNADELRRWRERTLANSSVGRPKLNVVNGGVDDPVLDFRRAKANRENLKYRHELGQSIPLEEMVRLRNREIAKLKQYLKSWEQQDLRDYRQHGASKEFLDKLRAKYDERRQALFELIESDFRRDAEQDDIAAE